jgi:hypothetical protein
MSMINDILLFKYHENLRECSDAAINGFAGSYMMRMGFLTRMKCEYLVNHSRWRVAIIQQQQVRNIVFVFNTNWRLNSLAELHHFVSFVVWTEWLIEVLHSMLWGNDSDPRISSTIPLFWCSLLDSTISIPEWSWIISNWSNDWINMRDTLSSSRGVCWWR